jgi:hypothetical protein
LQRKGYLKETFSTVGSKSFNFFLCVFMCELLKRQSKVLGRWFGNVQGLKKETSGEYKERKEM